MAEFITFKISGMDQLQKRLEELEKKAAKKIVRRGISAGAKIVRDAMVAFAPKKKGIVFTKSHFRWAIKMRSDELAGDARIGPTTEDIFYPVNGVKPKNKNDHRNEAEGIYGHKVNAAQIARYFEFGTKHQGAKPFLSQAFDSVKTKVQQVVADFIREELGL
jgi:HK97 gp10 family phage protein